MPQRSRDYFCISAVGTRIRDEYSALRTRHPASPAAFTRRIKGGPFDVTFAVLTPLLAASMAIVSGVSQSFQWGAAWSDMAITATRLEKERDRIAVTSPDQVDPIKEMATLDDLALSETQGFFQRLFGSGGQAKSQATPAAG